MAPSAVDRGLTDRTTAEILLWQNKLRLSIAGSICAISILMRVFGFMSGEWRFLAIALVAYLAVIGTVHLVVQRRGSAGAVILATTILADMAMIFGSTALVTEPVYYERALFLSLCTIQFAQFYFGRSAAFLGIFSAVIGYLLITAGAIGRGAPLQWSQELWAVGSFMMASVTFMIVHGNFKERLAYMASLFERAETGDFSKPFLQGGHAYPDSIALLGDSYNRVRVQLAEMVLTDPLSGLLNRRGFDQQLGRELARSSRSGRPIAMLAIDVDHFKVINDDFGHLAGDAVIREIGQLLRERARAGDVVARMGGEEFMVLAPDTDEQGALQLGDRLCLAFRNHPFPGVDGLPITASVGLVAEGTVTEQISADLRGRADEALYTAKRLGRNQVCLWTAGMKPFRPSPVGAMRKFTASEEPSVER